MPLQETSGAASYDAFGGGAAAIPNYIESCFSTYLYTGNGSTQTITNGIDLSTKGGLVWMKGRSGATDHALYDTVRGATKDLVSNSTAAQNTQATGLTAFSGTGFSIGALAKLNTNAATYAAWTFRKQAKFFDIVTYTGNGADKTITHNLGSVPGCIIIKQYSAGGEHWAVYHRSEGASRIIYLSQGAAAANSGCWNSTAPTATTFTVGSDVFVNESGTSYVAYLFAHNAGGFGLTGTDNVISCGSFTGTGAVNSPTITLGYEPQWLLIKKTDGTISASASSWTMWDNMRGITTGGNDSVLWANLSSSESTPNALQVSSTGFQIETDGSFYNESGATYIYIAIRRGPMKVPTSGTSVFAPVTATPSGATTVTTNFPVDLAINAQRDSATSGNKVFWDRLRGSSTAAGQGLFSNLTNAEVSYSGNGIGLQSNTTIVDNFWNTLNGATTPVIYWNFRRAPGFFDEVCYTGTGSYPFTVNHNLGVVPELMIFKKRSANENWWTYAKPLTAPNANWYQNYLVLNTTAARASDPSSMTTSPTSSAITLANFLAPSAATFVVYLFATVAGVSKVGSYTGTGTTQTINCGFTAGSRFVLIKRTDSTGDWYVWDSARGIVAGNDPHLSLNTTAAEVTTDDSVDTDSSGFIVNQLAATNVNASSATYIFLAIA